MQEASIRTPDQRLRVFVSSTLAELAEERAAVREAIQRLQLSPVMFELGARPHPPRELYRAYLEQSHIFVGIYWQRYGWVAPGEPVSGLEDEYRLSRGMPRLLYIKAAEEREPQLDELLRRIQEDDTASYKPFRTPEELTQLVASDLALLLSERFVTVRAPTGVVTFLFAEIPGNDSAVSYEKHAEAVRGIIRSRGGYLYTDADGVFRAAFAQPGDAVSAVSGLQSALAAPSSGDIAPPTVRAALHSGVAEVGVGDYFGPAVLRAATMLGLANDGQVLVSDAVVELLDRDVGPPLGLRSLGPHRIYDAGPAEEIHQLLIPGMPSEFPPIATSAEGQSNLPIQLTSFVGRQRELTEVKVALGDSRLVTLTGVGGAGKSRLALSAASEIADAFADGTRLIQLAPLRQPDQIPSAIAAGLGIPVIPDGL
jgi:class 3 adenylate cyclase